MAHHFVGNGDILLPVSPPHVRFVVARFILDGPYLKLLPLNKSLEDYFLPLIVSKGFRGEVGQFLYSPAPALRKKK